MAKDTIIGREVHILSSKEESSIKTVIKKKLEENFPFILTKRISKPVKDRVRVMVTNKVKICIMG
jgi:hypothetical protein